MLATYGVDVLDPGVSLRRIHVLARRLPPGALPAHASAAAWSTEAHLLANLCDAVNLLTWVTVRANGGKAARPPLMTRPGSRRPGPGPEAGRVRWGDLAGTLRRHGGMSGG